jgi:hypothetical protein
MRALPSLLLLLMSLLLAGCITALPMPTAEDQTSATLAAAPTQEATTAITLTSTPSAPDVLFMAEPETFYPNSYTLFFWRVEEAMTVYFDGEVVESTGRAARCLHDQTQVFILSVVRQDGTQEEYPIEVEVREEILSFETIGLEDYGLDVDSEDTSTKLFLLMEPADIAPVEKLITPQDWQTLQQLDFEEYVVIGLFRGARPSSNYDTVITRLRRYYQELLIVEAKFYIPVLQSSFAVVTSPYHLIKVSKTQMPRPLRLELQSRVVDKAYEMCADDISACK